MREKIIDNATKLFNKNGLNNTSFRDIAEKMNISDGHVRYYFKTKEVLLMTIFDKLDSEIIEAASAPISIQNDIYSSLKKSMDYVIELTVKYRFLFVESPQTISQYPKLLKSYRKLLTRRKKTIFGIFDSFEEMKLFNSHFDSQAREFVFYTLFIVSDGWLRTFQLTNSNVPNKKSMNFHSELFFSVLKPYLNIYLNTRSD